MQIFIIHGSYGSPQENWFPWLRGELETAGHAVAIPQFPVEDYSSFTEQLQARPEIKPTHQDLPVWLSAFDAYRHLVTEDSIFIAHSIAPAFVLHLLPTLSVPVKKCVFVAPFLQQVGIPEYDAVNRSFVETPVDWPAVGSHCRQFHVIGSDDDPYVRSELTREVTEQLSKVAPTEFHLVPAGKHFNSSAGFTTFPLVLSLV